MSMMKKLGGIYRPLDSGALFTWMLIGIFGLTILGSWGGLLLSFLGALGVAGTSGLSQVSAASFLSVVIMGTGGFLVCLVWTHLYWYRGIQKTLECRHTDFHIFPLLALFIKAQAEALAVLLVIGGPFLCVNSLVSAFGEGNSGMKAGIGIAAGVLSWMGSWLLAPVALLVGHATAEGLSMLAAIANDIAVIRGKLSA